MSQSSAYENISHWHDTFKLTIEEVRKRVLYVQWSSEEWAELQHWCKVFYGQPLFEPYVAITRLYYENPWLKPEL